MASKTPAPVVYQRNALAPAILAAIVLFVAPALMAIDWGLLVLFVVAILAVIVGYYAFQARQWVWVAVFAVIAVLWNPVFPLPWDDILHVVRIAAQPIAGVVFLVAGAVIKTPRA
jgi:hypothetical protein